ncbi:peptidase S41, partial [Enterococcus faecalis]
MVQEESISLPTLSKVGRYNVITIPGIYSLSESMISKYINTLSNLIEESKENIVLDLSNNPDGDVVPMLLGARSLIPDGLIFK